MDSLEVIVGGFQQGTCLLLRNGVHQGQTVGPWIRLQHLPQKPVVQRAVEDQAGVLLREQYLHKQMAAAGKLDRPLEVGPPKSGPAADGRWQQGLEDPM